MEFFTVYNSFGVVYGHYRTLASAEAALLLCEEEEDEAYGEGGISGAVVSDEVLQD